MDKPLTSRSLRPAPTILDHHPAFALRAIPSGRRVDVAHRLSAEPNVPDLYNASESISPGV